jgi:hypothetical protein
MKWLEEGAAQQHGSGGRLGLHFAGTLKSWGHMMRPNCESSCRLRWQLESPVCQAQRVSVPVTFHLRSCRLQVCI